MRLSSLFFMILFTATAWAKESIVCEIEGIVKKRNEKYFLRANYGTTSFIDVFVDSKNVSSQLLNHPFRFELNKIEHVDEFQFRAHIRKIKPLKAAAIQLYKQVEDRSCPWKEFENKIEFYNF